MTKISLSEFEIIGGHTCPRSPAPFGSGPVVVRKKDDHDFILIAYQIDASGASGDRLTPSQWKGLVEAFQATEIEPIPAYAYAVFWSFTSSFGNVYTNVRDLQDRRALLHMTSGANGVLMVVDATLCRGLRNTWAGSARYLAVTAMNEGDLTGAEFCANRCVSLLPELNREDVMLLAKVYERQGRTERAAALRMLQ